MDTNKVSITPSGLRVYVLQSIVTDYGRLWQMSANYDGLWFGLLGLGLEPTETLQSVHVLEGLGLSLWRIMADCGRLWRIMADYGGLWRIM